jgi:antitoxin (DNA-binding transcriptional repressor) of toxin-antitoxin stability system
MPETVTLQEAQAHLPDLIAQLSPGAELVITQDDRPVAKLVGPPSVPRQPRKPGSAKGKLIIHSDDEEHLNDFREYMP